MKSKKIITTLLMALLGCGMIASNTPHLPRAARVAEQVVAAEQAVGAGEQVVVVAAGAGVKFPSAQLCNPSTICFPAPGKSSLLTQSSR